MWMLVTDDGLELPVAVAASLSDISKSTGISLPCLSNMRQGRRHWSYLNRQRVKLVEVQTEMGTPLAELQLRMLPYNALRRNGIETIEQVLEMSTEQLMGLHGVGINIVAEVKAAAERWRDARGEACTHCNRAGSCPWESYEDCVSANGNYWFGGSNGGEFATDIIVGDRLSPTGGGANGGED